MLKIFLKCRELKKITPAVFSVILNIVMAHCRSLTPRDIFLLAEIPMTTDIQQLWNELSKLNEFAFISHLQKDEQRDLIEFHLSGIRFVEE